MSRARAWATIRPRWRCTPPSSPRFIGGSITGEGAEVNTSLLANGLWANGCQVQAALCDLELVPRAERGQRNPMVEYYETADCRAFTLAIVNTPREWPLLVTAIGRPEWTEDPLFATPLARFENADLLTSLLTEIFAGRPGSIGTRRLTPAGITYGLVGRITDHAADPQLEANHLLPEFVDGFGLKTLDSPFQVSRRDQDPPRMAPDIGQHTQQILKEFGAPAELAASA